MFLSYYSWNQIEENEHLKVYRLSMLCCICSLVFKQNLVHTISIIINVTGINAAVTSNEKACAVLPLLPRSMLSII